MSKKKGPTFTDHYDDSVATETREYMVHRTGLQAPSSNILYFYCPFCEDEVKAYLWSLSGGGKRCNCGAMFGSGGTALHYKIDK